MDSLTEAPARRELIWPIVSIVEPLDLSRMFPIQQPLELELGCGDSTFLVNHAKANPDRNFIGVERLKGRLSKLAKKAARAGLSNVMGLRIESSYLLRYLLPSECVHAIHIYFPDPWPKRKHHKHRLINPDFPALACRVLVSGGLIHLRTDNEEYFEQMIEVFGASPRFQRTPSPAALREQLTDFEREFNAKGIVTLHASFSRID